MTGKLATIVAEVLEVPPAAISAETSAATDARWDSMRHMQIIFAVEDAYGVRFQDQEIPMLTSVAAISAALAQLGISPDPSA